MKRCLSILFACFTLSAYAQTDRLYFDSNWKECPQTEAAYYRTVDKSAFSQSGLYLVKDFYADGTLEMEGAFSDDSLKIHQGDFSYYDQQGRIIKTCSYVDDKLNGMYTLYNSGNVFLREPYLDGVREGKGQYYFDNGQLSSEEYYENGVLIVYNMYNEDGSPAPQDDILERAAEFPGGRESMIIYLSENLHYPPSAVKNELEGKAYVKFSISATGGISKVSMAKKIPGCPECDAEAIRVVSEMPDWIPGIYHHRTVDSYFLLPITFKLTGGKKRKAGRN